MPDDTPQSRRRLFAAFQFASTCNWQPYYETKEQLFEEIKLHFEALLIVFMAADGELTKDELVYSLEYMGMNVDTHSADEFTDRVESTIESANKYVSRVPKYFRMAVEHDRKNASRVSSQILGCLYSFAMLTMGADGESQEEELDLFKSIFSPYVALLEKEDIKDADEAIDENEEADSSENKASTQQRALTELLSDLHSLVGLDAVKAEVSSIVNLIKVRRLREKNGIKSPPMSLHLVFSGNPGTGKTTVARLIAEIYRELGVLEKGHLIEVDRSGLVAGYVGQTALRVQEVCKKALGGILFIDEAYTLSKSGEPDYGTEAIDTLLKFMEDNRNRIIVIAAGYSDRMKQFLDSNPGLQSRFNKHIQFDDYTEDDLFDIFLGIASEHGYAFDHIFAKRLREIFAVIIQKKQPNFGNGRVVRNLFERAVENHSNRVAELDSPTKIQLTAFAAEDLNGIGVLDSQ